MAIKVTLTNKSQQTGQASDITSTGELQLSRIVYQHLRSLTKNKNISQDYDNGSLPLEYVEILEELGRFQDGEIVDASIEMLDEYLGSLGITLEYHYKKDLVDVLPWIEASEQLPIRTVVDRATLAQCVDRDTNFNVVHNTGLEG